MACVGSKSAKKEQEESRFWGVFIIAVHRAFVLGLGARHRGIVDLSEGVIRCDSVRLLFFFFFFRARTRDNHTGLKASAPLATAARVTHS